MNRSNARQNTLGIVVALVAIALLVAVLLASRAVPDKPASDPAATQLVTTEGENEQWHPSSLLKKPPGEGTGPTMHADFRGNFVGRVPSRGERDVVQQTASRTEAEAADPAPPDWAFYGTCEEVKPVLGETYPDHPMRDPRPSTSSPGVGLHVPE